MSLIDPIYAGLREAAVNIPKEDVCKAISVPQASAISADGVSLGILRFETASNSALVTLTAQTGSSPAGLSDGPLYPFRDDFPTGVIHAGPGSNVVVIQPDQFVETANGWCGLAILRALNTWKPEPIKIEAKQGSQTVTLSTGQYAPPVVAIHGVWSEGPVWKKLRSYLESSYPTTGVLMCDYKDFNSEAFDDSRTIDRLRGCIRAALGDAVFLRGVIATQVDVVAHSMGGLVTRTLAGSTHYKTDPRNYMQGSIRRLITVGTPHQGSPLANYLLGRRGNTTEGSLLVKGILNFNKIFTENSCPSDTGMATLSQTFACLGQPIAGAVESFDPSTGHLALLSSQLPYHAIVGFAPEFSNTESLLDVLIADFDGKPSDNSDTLETAMAGGGSSVPHDTIVPTISQQGDACTSDPVPGIVHASPVDASDTNSDVVFALVKSLLSRSVILCDTTATAQGPDDARLTFLDTPQPPPLASIDFSSMTELPASEFQLSPTPGIELPPSELATIVVSASTHSIIRSVFFSNGGFVDASAEPFSATISKDSLDPLAVGIVVLFSDNTFARTTASYTTASPEELVFLDVETKDVFLSDPGDTFQLLPIARYSNASVDVRDQATYAVRSDKDTVISVSPSGVVAAIGNGSGLVDVSFGGVTEVVRVTVGKPQSVVPTLPASRVWSTAILLALTLAAPLTKRRRSKSPGDPAD